MPERAGGMVVIEPGSTLGELVAERNSRAALFERLHLDFCCGGGQTLAQACESRGLDPDTVCRMLEALDDPTPERRDPEATDWRRASIGELVDHIVTAHHDHMRAELPRISELMATVVRVHGSGHPEMHDLGRTFEALRGELELHMRSEEREVFPACRAAEGAHGGVDETVLATHEHEHAETGDLLVALRELGNDYNTAGALCGTHRRLLQGLQELELDLHQHIHEENNVLFPRVRELCGGAAGQ